jgi:hypothetical protein
MALSDELDADEYAAQTVAHRFFNNGTPELLVSMLGVRQEELDAMRRSWDQGHRGWKRVGRPKFVNQEMKVEKLDSSFADLQLVELRQYQADLIRETFGIPPEILGNVQNSNRATIQASQYLFAINTLVPRLEMLEDYINTRLVPMFGAEDSLIITYETPVPEDLEFLKNMIASTPWAFSIDEVRDLGGKAPLPDGGDKHVLQLNETPVDLAAGEKPLPDEEPDESNGQRGWEWPDRVWIQPETGVATGTGTTWSDNAGKPTEDNGEA